MQVHAIDLQYHAGQERLLDRTLEDYVEHAVQTGREVLGITDHIEIYVGDNDTEGPYERSVAGLAAYRADMDEVREAYPDCQLLLGPEIGRGFDFEAVPDDIVDLADYFVCEISLPREDREANTDAMIEELRAITRFGERVDRPVFVAHPFRSSVNRRLVKQPIDAWITALGSRRPHEWDREDVDSFFLFDVARFGRAAAELNLPLEINGNSHLRAMGANIPAAIQLLRAAYRTLRETGATFVPGSDQHQFERRYGRRGGFVPWETFAAIDVGVDELGHLEAFGIELAEA